MSGSYQYKYFRSTITASEIVLSFRHMQPCAQIAGSPLRWSANQPPDNAQLAAEPPQGSTPDTAIEASPSDRKSFPPRYPPAVFPGPADSFGYPHPTNTGQRPSSANRTPRS